MDRQAETVVVIGFGKIVSDVLGYLSGQRIYWGYELQFIEFEPSYVFMIKRG